MPDLGPDDKRPAWRKDLTHDRPDDWPRYLSFDCAGNPAFGKVCTDPQCGCVCHLKPGP